jgi:sulfite reductase (NADPH) flavoprotein alpha-component
MNEAKSVPYIPDTAPFTPEQRAYLNGFFAGLFSRTAADPSSLTSPPSASLHPLTILFGSQTGNAEALAKRVAKEAGRRGFAPMVYDLAQYPFANLKSERNLLLITSTYGDGDPPDNAKGFWEFLSNGESPSLANLTFSVLALGDSNYPKFCACGKNFDQRLEQLGAKRAHARVDCDVDYEEPFCAWMKGVLSSLNSDASTLRIPQAPNLEPRPATYSRSNPFHAHLITNRVLNGPGSAKETRHFEISLEGSSLAYEAGDALAVVPTNCPQLVDEVLCALGSSDDEPLRKSLLHDYDITKISQLLIAALAERSGDEQLKKLASPNVNGELKKFLWGREVIDLLLAYPQVKWTPAEFVKCLKKLQPRLYSISSSPKMHSKNVHLTVSIVRYESLGRPRKGICSSFLADRACSSTPVPVFVHSTKNFRLPQDPARPMIMVGHSARFCKTAVRRAQKGRRGYFSAISTRPVTSSTATSFTIFSRTARSLVSQPHSHAIRPRKFTSNIACSNTPPNYSAGCKTALTSMFVATPPEWRKMSMPRFIKLFPMPLLNT